MHVRVNKLYLILVVVLVVTVVFIVFVWLPKQFENYHLDIMRNCNSTATKTAVRSWFDSDYNFTEIYEWVHEKLEFVPFNETFTDRHTDPSEILESGKGRCGEFSILYVAACLAHGYQSRLIISTDISNPINWVTLHAWAEVRLNDQWVHVDPSERRWDDPHMYEKWSWGENIRSKVRMFAFEDGRWEDVTQCYRQKD